jgi:hypothetical protein
MLTIRSGFALGCIAAALLVAEPAEAQPVTVVAEDFLQVPASAGSPPLARINVMREVPDGSDRMFINDLEGPFYVIDEGAIHTYMDFSVEFPSLKTSPGLASGFVSFAFDPEFATSGLIYTVHSEFVGAVPPNINPPLAATIIQHSVLTEWTAVDPSSNSFSGTRRELMRVASAHPFHNMGEIAFNPYATQSDDDYRLLYIGNGDYGTIAIGEPDQLQRLDTVWGTILRIDPLGGPFTRGATTYGYGVPPDNPFVDGNPDTFDEIYAYGFRNNHRLAWDPVSGKLFGSDIGQGNYEEINLIMPGRNYGWPIREGNMALDPLDPETVFALPPDDALLGYTYPVALYDHGAGSAIAGGFPYWGVGNLDLRGKFLFGDIVSGELFHADIADLEAADDGDPATMAPIVSAAFVHDGQSTTLLQVVRDALNDQGINRTDLRFALDGSGELWITTKQDGFIRRLIGGTGAGPGRTPATLTIEKAPSGQLQLTWDSSVCSGSTDHAIYEGSIGSWTSHQSITCTDTGGDRQEIIAPSAGDRYYLVVPLDTQDEGSYGVDSQATERSRALTGLCRSSQELGCL